MAKTKKKKSARKALKQKTKNKKIIQIITLIIIAAFAIIYIFKPTGNSIQTRKKKMNYESPYQFTKNGELIFQSAEGEYITKIEIEIANTEAKRALGLMYRNKMREDRGMLFVFDDEQYRSFWMKNTILPLDMIFVNSKLEIINIRKNTRPFDESQYISTAPAKYVIEVNAGFTNRYNIKSGDKISFRIQ